MRVLLLAALAAALTAAPAGHLQVAITIDDLPRDGGDGTPCDAAALRTLTARLLSPLNAGAIPVTGFVIASRCREVGEDAWYGVLQQWLDAGAELGNHTWSHPDINQIPLAEYEADVARGDRAIRGFLQARGHTLRYFRHPFLHTGIDQESKQGLERYLETSGYTVAPVTFDNSDYMFAAVYASAVERGGNSLALRVKNAYIPYMDSILAFFEQRAVEVVGHPIPQILLIHASRLNADCMPALIGMLRRRGYEFVTLERALADEAYRLPNYYAGPGGFSWIHRWSMSLGMQNKGEPDEPAWIAEEYRKIRRAPTRTAKPPSDPPSSRASPAHNSPAARPPPALPPLPQTSTDRTDSPRTTGCGALG